jgi:hypothetical protein
MGLFGKLTHSVSKSFSKISHGSHKAFSKIDHAAHIVSGGVATAAHKVQVVGLARVATHWKRSEQPYPSSTPRSGLV